MYQADRNTSAQRLNFHPPGQIDYWFEQDLSATEAVFAGLMTILAYPDPNDEWKQERIYWRFLAWTRGASFDEQTDEERKLAKGQHGRALIRADDVRARLALRLKAAHYGAWGILNATGLPTRQPKDWPLITHSHLIEYASATEKTENFQKRSWGLSLPVLHIASALAILAQYAAAAGERLDVQRLAADRELLSHWVHLSIALEPKAAIFRPRSLNSETMWRLALH